MRLSAPVYRLRREAKRLSREHDIPHHEALRRIARKEGFRDWSLLIAAMAKTSPAAALFRGLLPGDLLIVAARPGQGKTLLALELAAMAAKAGRRATFFTLEYTPGDVDERLAAIGTNRGELGTSFACDCSDLISADHIIGEMASAEPGSFAIIDYLQLLDQRRENPDLAVQVDALRSFAKERGVIVVCLAQVDRQYDAATKAIPDLDDLRLPNPFDPRIFDKACFLNAGQVEFRALE
jgi:replicative DNA helicase